jgi:hypothetical protein
MPGLLDRSIDRELGLEAPGEGRNRAPESWLRDWPLLLGLVLSASLIAASTTVSGGPDRPHAKVASSNAAEVGSVPGHAVDVGEADAPAPAQPRAGKHVKAKPATVASKPKANAGHARSQPSSEAADPGVAAAQPRAKRAPARSGSPSDGVATPGRIVNVTGTSATFANGPLSYSFSAPTHTPTVGKRWRLQISVTKAGAPLTGSVRIDILHNGAIVGHAASGKLAAGRFAHDFDWPDRSAGIPLTVKTTVVGGGYQQSFLFNVKVQGTG